MAQMRRPGRPRRLAASRLAGGLQFARYAADRGLGHAMAKGAFERAELACAVRLVGPGDVAIDGGAHLGFYALHLAQRVGPAGSVQAFEPHPETRALLLSSARSNAFLGNLSVCGAALGDQSRPGVLRTPRRRSAHAHAALDRHDAPVSRAERLIPVDVVALDEIDIAARVALIKLDIEGAELLAIRGALDLIRRDRPAILCDLGDAELARVSGGTSVDVIRTLAAVGYRAYDIQPDGSTGPRRTAAPTAWVATVLFLPNR